MITTTPQAGLANVLIPTEPIFRLSVEQYHDMIRQGILTDDDPVELLEGWLVYKMSKYPKHSSVTRRLRNALEHRVPTGWLVDSQEPITLSDSEPEPDAFVAQGDDNTYLERHPGAQDLALVVEVADSTVLRDRGIKKRLYARAGIAVYWIVNIPERVVEVYTQPAPAAVPPDYQQCATFAADALIPIRVGDQELMPIPAASLWP